MRRAVRWGAIVASGRAMARRRGAEGRYRGAVQRGGAEGRCRGAVQRGGAEGRCRGAVQRGGAEGRQLCALGSRTCPVVAAVILDIEIDTRARAEEHYRSHMLRHEAHADVLPVVSNHEEARRVDATRGPQLACGGVVRTRVPSKQGAETWAG